MIGRDEGNAVFPQDRFMSRHHASIFSKNGDIYLNDANSRNGSYIRKEGAILLKVGTSFWLDDNFLGSRQ